MTDAEGSWSATTTPAPVARDATVNLRAVVKVTGAPHNYYWGYPTGSVSGIGTAYQWSSSWGSPSIEWNSVMPAMSPPSSNDPWNTGYGGYTNVTTSNDAGTATCPDGHHYTNPGALERLNDPFGQCSATACCGTHNCSTFRGVYSRTNEGNAYDTIVYNQSSPVSGWAIIEPGSTPEGTRRYRISACTYRDSTKYSPGKADASTRSHLIWDSTNPDRSYDRGIMTNVTRIVRLSNHAITYIRHVESYRLVPWIYGSIDSQADNYIGFDCADLAVAGARKAGYSVAYTSANGLKGTRPAIGRAKEPYYLDGDTIRRRLNNQACSFTIGTDIAIGDLILIDYDRGGTADHTTILYSGSGTLGGAATLIMAGRPGGVTTATLGAIASSNYNLYFRRGW